MSRYVEIEFECLPLRSVGRFDIPLDASPEDQALWKRVHLAAEKHGVFNTYYLYDARCVFHLTNDVNVGMVEYRFEGTVFTDSNDTRTVSCELSAELAREDCDWLSGAVIEWFRETVAQAVKVEFDRYIAAGDLQRTVERMQRIQAESDARGGFMGMGL